MIEILTETTEEEFREAHEHIMSFVEYLKANPQVVEAAKKEIAKEDAEQGLENE